MIVIKNSKLFSKLKLVSEDAPCDTFLKTLFKKGVDGAPEIEDDAIPVLTGGLDFVNVTKKSIIFIDRCCNDADNSFCIRKN